MSESRLTEMPSHPTLVRVSAPRVTLREGVTMTIRGECAARKWDSATLAEILHASIQRARDLRAGRRALTIDELDGFCTAAKISPVEFFDKVAGRRSKDRVFADTTMGELVVMAARSGTTPAQLLTRDGWCSQPKAAVPAHLGGDA